MHLQVYLYDNVFVGTIKDRSKRGQIFIFNRKGENSNSSFTRYENDLNGTVCKYIHVSVHKAQHIQLNEDLRVYICCLTCQNQLSIQFPRNCLHRSSEINLPLCTLYVYLYCGKYFPPLVSCCIIMLTFVLCQDVCAPGKIKF